MLQMTWGVQHSHLLRQVNPEFTHNLGLRSLQMYLQRQLKRADQPRAHLCQEALPWKSPIPDNSRENQRIYQKLITDLYQTTGNLSIYIYIYTITVINAKSVACAAHIPTNYTSTKAVSPFQPRSHGYWWQFILTISTLLRDTLKIVALCFNALARMPNSGRVPSHVRCCAWDPTICLSVSDWIDSKHRCKNT